MIPKFKAWDKKYKKIMKVNQIDFEKRTVWIEADNGDHENRHTLTREFGDIELMQATGLKDKNGVEIFEGDVCEWHIPDMGRPEPDAMIRYVSVVEYRNGSFNLSGYLFPNVRLIKVIGNIYENPELLEVEG